MKFNQNHYGFSLDEPFPPTFGLQPGESKNIKLRCSLGVSKGGAPPQKPPVLIQAGLKCSLDLFYFSIPALLQVTLAKQQADPNQVQKLWVEVPTSPENVLMLPSMSPQITNAHSLINRLQDNNILFMS